MSRLNFGLNTNPVFCGGFVARVEDVLDVYHGLHNTDCSVICMGESDKQLSIEVRQPIPAGRCEDSEWKRNGVVDVFMFVEPLIGRRFVP